VVFVRWLSDVDVDLFLSRHETVTHMNGIWQVLEMPNSFLRGINQDVDENLKENWL
jgi:hypothetical protein